MKSQCYPVTNVFFTQQGNCLGKWCQPFLIEIVIPIICWLHTCWWYLSFYSGRLLSLCFQRGNTYVLILLSTIMPHVASDTSKSQHCHNISAMISMRDSNMSEKNFNTFCFHSRIAPTGFLYSLWHTAQQKCPDRKSVV